EQLVPFALDSDQQLTTSCADTLKLGRVKRILLRIVRDFYQHGAVSIALRCITRCAANSLGDEVKSAVGEINCYRRKVGSFRSPRQPLGHQIRYIRLGDNVVS